MDGINAWWDGLAGERFWLGVTGHDGNGEVLASPCGPRNGVTSGTQPLIHHVREGDAVFQYDEVQQAIVSWSTPRGRVQKRRLSWSDMVLSGEDSAIASSPVPSWTITLEGTKPLESAVPLAEIARVQWDLFPELREFEDRVGEPLHYPFAMGDASSTLLLPGYVFKIPALFVQRFPALARVAEQVRWTADARTRASDRPREEPFPATRETRGVPSRASESVDR
jgi:hypothetical protein